MKQSHPLVSKFDKEFREYLNASIAFAEVQQPYRVLDIEDEIKWIKNWIWGNMVQQPKVRTCCKQCRTYEGFACKRDGFCTCHNPDPTCCIKCAKMTEIDTNHFAGICFDHKCECHLKA